MDEEQYQEEIVPDVETLEQTLTEAGLPYLILIMLDDENVEYRNSIPPEGVKHLDIKVFRDKKTKVKPVFDTTVDRDAIARVIENMTPTTDASFNGSAVQFQIGEETETEHGRDV
jgi:hypothetical protein